MIRFFDVVFSLIGLIIFFPLFILISIWISADSRGGIFYLQWRVGKNNHDFKLIKFRSMHTGADNLGSLTIGAKDNRITPSGYFLRKFKLDEFPQLINVLKGDMSMVGPRPDLRKYADLYTDEEKIVLSLKPGITDWASIEYINEDEILGSVANPEKTYIEVILPAKIALNKRYLKNMGIREYFIILMKTFLKLTRN